MKTLNIIGCGNLGQTLGRLWAARAAVAVQDVLNRSLASAERAVSFIGAGRAVACYEKLRAADICLIATRDDAIAGCCEALVAAGALGEHCVVFHCSGALPAAALRAAAERGAPVASVHPVRTFPAPARALEGFAGTGCGCEGDSRALGVLRPLFEAIGARLFTIDAGNKVLYHAAAVIACNYLTALLASAGRVYVQAGIPEGDALRLMEPIVRDTVENVFALGPARALTGPVARGDHAVVGRQARALARRDPELARMYRALGRLTVALAREQGGASAAELAAVAAALNG